MSKPTISIVVAVTGKNHAIGNGGKLLVHISDDLKRFKAITRGHPIIWGRKTYESIGHPLPERTNIIITRNPDFKAEGCIVVPSLEEALQKAASLPPLQSSLVREVPRSSEAEGVTSLPAEDGGTPFIKGDFPTPEIFIGGGGEIYREALPYVDKLYLTIVESDAQGDVFFPDWRKDFTKETFREKRFDEKTGLKYTWIDLERTPSTS